MDRHVKRFAGCSKENTTTENSDVNKKVIGKKLRL